MNAMPRPTVFGSVIRYWPIVILALVVGAVAGLGSAKVTKPKPTATAIVVVQDPRATGTIDGTAAARYAAEQVALIKSDLVLSPTKDALNSQGIGRTITELRSSISVAAPTDSNALRVTATDRSTTNAAAIANGVVDQYRATLGKQLESDATAQLAKIDSQIAALQKQIPATGNTPAADLARAERAGLLNLRANVVAQLTAGDGVLAVSPATAGPAGPSHGSLTQGVGLGAVVGLLLGALIAALLANRRQRWEAATQPGALFDRGCIAEIRLAQKSRPAHAGSNGFDAAAAGLLGLQQSEDVWAIGLVAGSAQPPVADAVLGLGAASARLARRVLLLISSDAPVSGSGAHDVTVLEPGGTLQNLPVSIMQLGNNRHLHVAATDVIEAESFLRRARDDRAVRAQFDLVLVAIRLAGQADVLLASEVDINVVALADHGRVAYTENVAERLAALSATTAGCIYLSGKRRDRQTPLGVLLSGPATEEPSAEQAAKPRSKPGPTRAEPRNSTAGRAFPSALVDSE